MFLASDAPNEPDYCIFCGKPVWFWQRRTKYTVTKHGTNEVVDKGICHKRCVDKHPDKK